MMLKKPSRIRVILAIFSAILLYGIIAGVRANSSILITQISGSTGLSYGDVSTAFAVLNLVFALSIVFIGFLALKVQKAYLMGSGAALCAIGFFGASFSTTLPLLILFIGVIFGIGASLLSFTITFSAVKIFVEEKTASILSGVLFASQGAMGILYSHIINNIGEIWGTSACLLSISLTTVCLIPFAFIFLQRKKKENQPKEIQQPPSDSTASSLSAGNIVHKMVTNPFFLLVALGAFIYGMGDGGLMNHTSQFMNDLFQTGEYTPAIVSVYSISIMFGALAGGFIAAKAKSRSITFGVLLLAWISVNILITFVIYFGFFGVDSSILAVSLTFLSGFLINATGPLLIMFAVERVSVAATASVLSIIDCLIFLAYSVNSFFGGYVHDLFGSFASFDLIIAVLAAIIGVVFIIYGTVSGKKKLETIF